MSATIIAAIAIGFIAVIANASVETTVSGVVVDTRGRPVPQALISYTLRERAAADGVVHIVVGTDIQADRDGRFEFTTTERISEVMIRADSPDLKRTGRLEHVRKTGNVVVVR